MPVNWTVPPSNNSRESLHHFGEQAAWNAFFKAQVIIVADALNHGTDLETIVQDTAQHRQAYAITHPAKGPKADIAAALATKQLKPKQKAACKSFTDRSAAQCRRYGKINAKNKCTITSLYEGSTSCRRWGNSSQYLKQMYHCINPDITTAIHVPTQPSCKHLELVEDCGAAINITYSPAWIGPTSSFNDEFIRLNVTAKVGTLNRCSSGSKFDSANTLHEQFTITSPMPFTHKAFNFIQITFVRCTKLSATSGETSLSKTESRLNLIFCNNQFDFASIFEQLAQSGFTLQKKILLLTYLMAKACPFASGNKSIGEILFHGYQYYAQHFATVSSDLPEQQDLPIAGKLPGDWDWQVMLHSYDCFVNDIIATKPPTTEEPEQPLSQSRLPLWFKAKQKAAAEPPVRIQLTAK